MKGVNRVTIIGRLGQDPEVRFFPDGGSVTNATLATSEKWKDKQTGEAKESTEWHRVVFKNKLAEIAGQYLKKGSLVYVEGKLNTRKWQNQQGQDQYTTEINVLNMQMLDSKNQNTGQQQQQQGFNQSAPQQQVNPQYQSGFNQQPNPQQQTPKVNPQEPDFDDDLPFAPIALQYRSLLNVI